MRNFGVFFLFLLMGSSVFATNTSYSGTLSFVGTDWAGSGYIFGITGVKPPCSFGQFSMSSAAPGYKDQVATLMMAYAMGKSVTVTTDANNTCPNNRANIIGVFTN